MVGAAYSTTVPPSCLMVLLEKLSSQGEKENYAFLKMLLFRSSDYQIHLCGLYCSGVYKTFRILFVEVVYVEKK